VSVLDNIESNTREGEPTETKFIFEDEKMLEISSKTGEVAPMSSSMKSMRKKLREGENQKLNDLLSINPFACRIKKDDSSDDYYVKIQ